MRGDDGRFVAAAATQLQSTNWAGSCRCGRLALSDAWGEVLRLGLDTSGTDNGSLLGDLAVIRIMTMVMIIEIAMMVVIIVM